MAAPGAIVMPVTGRGFVAVSGDGWLVRPTGAAGSGRSCIYPKACHREQGGPPMTPPDREALRAELARRAREILERSHVTVSQAKDAPSVRTDVDDIGEISVDDAIKT